MLYVGFIFVIVIFLHFVVFSGFEHYVQDGVDEDGEPLVARFPNGKPMGAQYERESEIELIRDIGHGRYGQVKFIQLRFRVSNCLLFFQYQV